MKLTKLKIERGIYHGILITESDNPDIRLMHGTETVAKAVLKTQRKKKYQFAVQITLPLEAVSEGTSVFAITDADTSEVLDFIPVVIGQLVEESVSTRLDQLQQELDLVKSVLRKLGRN